MADLEHIIDDIGGGELELVELLRRHDAQIYGFWTDGARAASLWDALYNRLDQAPYWPVILGTEHDTTAHQEAMAMLTQSGSDGIEQRTRATFANLESMPLDDALSASFDMSSDAADDIDVTPAADWTGARPNAAELALEVPQNLALGSTHDSVAVALVPSEYSWACPALLNFGGWNDCPRPEAHAAQLARWAEQWGAELISSSDTTMELRVARQPQSWKAGFDLASEHADYCPELISRGSWNLRTLAEYLCGHYLWRFWWS